VEDGSVAVLQPAVYLDLQFRRPAAADLTRCARRLLRQIEDRASTRAWRCVTSSRPRQRSKAASDTTVSRPELASIPGVGNPDLKHFRALQTSAGVERRLGDRRQDLGRGILQSGGRHRDRHREPRSAAVRQRRAGQNLRR
jgi:hypothetical protein